MSKLKISILAPLALFIIALVAGFSSGVYIWQENRDAQALEKINNDFGGIFNRLISSETKMMEATLASISRDEMLIKHFVARDREKLLTASMPLFQELREKHKITHLYFSGTDRINFLRVHQPDRYGDVINRTTTRLAEQNQHVNSGLELGALGTFTLRVVLPLNVDGRLIGYLELGSEIDHVISGVRDFLGMDLYVFTPKTNLTRRNWESGADMLGAVKDWDQLEDYVVNASAPIPRFLAEHVNQGGLQTAGIIKDVKWGERIVSLLHKPIINALGEETEIIVAIHDETALDKRRSEFIFLTVVIGIGVGSGLFVLFWFILNTVEQNIRNTEQNLIHAKEAAEAASVAKTQFLANMSHELRTPLNAILGFSEMMKLQAFGPIGDDKYREYAHDIHFSGCHLLSLINDVLQISKIEAGSHNLHMKTFDVPELVLECLVILNERAAKFGVSLVNEVPQGLGAILADRRAIQQCLINILSNAIKFTPANGMITISASEDTRWFNFTITDTGIGIDKDDLSKLTQPFTQIERAQTARIHEGTGLGLTITRNLVEMHGGGLIIESLLNVGTVVTIRLPRGEAVYAGKIPESSLSN